MLKTNNKEVKKYMNDYIKETMLVFLSDEIDNKQITFEEALEKFFEYYNEIYLNHEHLFHSDFIEFMTNHIGAFDYYTYKQKETIKEALQESNEEASKYDEEQIEKMYFYLIAQNIEKALNVKRVMRFHDNRYVSIYVMNKESECE